MSRNENDDHFEAVLKRVEALAIENSRLRDDVRRAETLSDRAANATNNYPIAMEHLLQATHEIERLKKKHPRLVKLPAFMRPQSDDDIPF